MEENKKEGYVLVTKASEKWEGIAGILIAFFASMMAITEVVSSNVEMDRNQAEVRRIEMSNWYQSKSIKQGLQENQYDIIKITRFDNAEEKELLLSKIKKEIDRYKAEKNEIFKGSKSLKKEQWVQDKDGVMGVIVGVKEYENQVENLDRITPIFDISKVFFQICLVLGAVSIIIIDNPRLQKSMVALMVILGIIGIILSLIGGFKWY
jgi:hypothetical protein